MGRTTRWLRSLWGVKKEQGKSSGSIDKKEKRRWSFGKLSRKASATAPESWPRPYQDVFFAEAEKEQSKHAIVVAAATAAAADAAVAAAQAAAAVVRLTSHNRNSAIPICRWGHDHLAAVKIQTTFRGYLARKALRALKGLVKLQAHVRGYLVRKEAAATLHSMQALFRAQATIRRHQSRCCVPKNSAFHHEASCGRSMERFDETGRKNMPNIHSRRLSAAIENDQTVPESPKIVEIDTFRPKLRSRRRNLSASESFPFSPPYDHQSGYQPPIIPASSPLMPVPGRLSVPDTWSLNWNLPGDECRFSTAHSTPRFAKPVVHDSSRPATPTAKSVCGDGGFRRRYSGSPNYMSNTQSFRAKARSQSAPKHRPDPLTKRRLSLQEAVEARASLSGVRMQRSSSQAQEPFSFKHAVVNRLDRSVDACPSSCLDREYLVSLQTRW